LEGFEIGEAMDEMGEVQIKNNEGIIRRRKRSVQFHSHFGVGAHLLPSDAANMSTTYRIDGANTVSTTAEMPNRNFEIIGTINFSLVFKDRWFVQMGSVRDFYNSIYRKNSYGVGWQFNASKGRPFYIKPSIAFTDFKYARKIEQAQNDFGKFEFGKKNFREGAINMYYGNRTFNLKGSLELAIELNPATEFFVRGSYMLPFATNNHLYLWERKRFPRRKDRSQLNQNITIERDDSSFEGDIARYGDGALFTIGVVKKTY